MQTALRTARLESGLSINKLAKQTGLDAGALSRIERGLRAPSIDSAQLILKAFPTLTLSDLQMQ